jgi:hypothetical protein
MVPRVGHDYTGWRTTASGLDSIIEASQTRSPTACAFVSLALLMYEPVEVMPSAQLSSLLFFLGGVGAGFASPSPFSVFLSFWLATADAPVFPSFLGTPSESTSEV